MNHITHIASLITEDGPPGIDVAELNLRAIRRSVSPQSSVASISEAIRFVGGGTGEVRVGYLTEWSLVFYAPGVSGEDRLWLMDDGGHDGEIVWPPGSGVGEDEDVFGTDYFTTHTSITSEGYFNRIREMKVDEELSGLATSGDHQKIYGVLAERGSLE